MNWDGSERRAERAAALANEVVGLAGAVKELTEYVGRAATSEQVIRTSKSTHKMIVAMTIAAVVSVMIVSGFIMGSQNRIANLTEVNKQGVRCIVGQQGLSRGTQAAREQFAKQFGIDPALLPVLPEPDPRAIEKDCALFLEHKPEHEPGEE